MSAGVWCAAHDPVMEVQAAQIKVNIIFKYRLYLHLLPLGHTIHVDYRQILAWKNTGSFRFEPIQTWFSKLLTTLDL